MKSRPTIKMLHLITQRSVRQYFNTPYSTASFVLHPFVRLLNPFHRYPNPFIICAQVGKLENENFAQICDSA